MSNSLVAVPPAPLPALIANNVVVPALIADAGDQAAYRFREFLRARLPNENTRAAYAHAISEFFFWCSAAGVPNLACVNSLLVSRYVDQLKSARAPATVKQHLAAIRMLFDWLVTGQVIPHNPASAVRAPKHVVKKGKTPVLSVEEARTLLNGIPTARGDGPETECDVIGLRDRALIAVMVYSFARVSAVTSMKVRDYYTQGRRAWFRLHEKGGKRHEVPAHHKAEEYVDAYIAAAGIEHDRDGPLFRSVHGTSGTLRKFPLSRSDVYRMIRRRAKAVGLETPVCCHSFRATGITAYLENGGSLEHAQQIAAHESPKTTKLYDHTCDQITLDEIERIAI